MCFKKSLLKVNQKLYDSGKWPDIDYLIPAGWHGTYFDNFQQRSETLKTFQVGIGWDLQDSPYQFIDSNVVFSARGLELLLTNDNGYKGGCLRLNDSNTLTAPFRIQIIAQFQSKIFFPALWLWSIFGTGREYDLMECTDGKTLRGTAHRWDGKHEATRNNTYLETRGGETFMYEIEVLPNIVNWYLNSRLIKTHSTWLPGDSKFILIFSSQSEKFAECPAVMNVSFLRILKPK